MTISEWSYLHFLKKFKRNLHEEKQKDSPNIEKLYIDVIRLFHKAVAANKRLPDDCLEIFVSSTKSYLHSHDKKLQKQVEKRKINKKKLQTWSEKDRNNLPNDLNAIMQEMHKTSKIKVTADSAIIKYVKMKRQEGISVSYDAVKREKYRQINNLKRTI